MKLHPNAKTTPHMRALLVERLRNPAWTPAAAARAAGISVRTAYKWRARYQTAWRPCRIGAPRRSINPGARRRT